MLRSPAWGGVFRSRISGEAWSARQTFEAVKREFVEFSWVGPINLPNFPKSGSALRLETSLLKTQGIKPKKSFPLMIVSKVLHFYNPSLFPIYDTWMIWNKVLNGRFKADYRAFCERERIPKNVGSDSADDTAVWLIHYMNLASTQVCLEFISELFVFVRIGVEQLDRIRGRTYGISVWHIEVRNSSREDYTPTKNSWAIPPPFGHLGRNGAWYMRVAIGEPEYFLCKADTANTKCWPRPFRTRLGRDQF